MCPKCVAHLSHWQFTKLLGLGNFVPAEVCLRQWFSCMLRDRSDAERV